MTEFKKKNTSKWLITGTVRTLGIVPYPEILSAQPAVSLAVHKFICVYRSVMVPVPYHYELIRSSTTIQYQTSFIIRRTTESIPP